MESDIIRWVWTYWGAWSGVYLGFIPWPGMVNLQQSRIGKSDDGAETTGVENPRNKSRRWAAKKQRGRLKVLSLRLRIRRSPDGDVLGIMILKGVGNMSYPSQTHKYRIHHWIGSKSSDTFSQLWLSSIFCFHAILRIIFTFLSKLTLETGNNVARLALVHMMKLSCTLQLPVVVPSRFSLNV